MSENKLGIKTSFTPFNDFYWNDSNGINFLCPKGKLNESTMMRLRKHMILLFKKKQDQKFDNLLN